MKSPPLDSRAIDLYRYAGLGLQFAVTLIVFAFLGWWSDRRLGWSPWLLITGVFLGFGLGLFSMVSKLPSSRASNEPGGAAIDDVSEEHADPPR